MPRVPAGQDRGRGWDALDGERLRALARDRDEDVCFSAETELRRRGQRGGASVPSLVQGSLL